MSYLIAFIAGFISTLVFHQGLVWLFYELKLSPIIPWDTTSVPPLNVPSVISLAFWGGIWGALMWVFLQDSIGYEYWLYALLFGAVFPSVVALFIVMPLKGLGFAAGWDPKVITGAMLLNGAWGFGTALILRLLNI